MSRTGVNVNGTGIGTYHLSENPALYEPSRNNAFELVIDLSADKDMLLAAGVTSTTATDDDYFANVSDVIRLSVDESFVPHFDLEVIRVRRGNSEMKFAGTPSFSEGQIKVNDYVGARTKDILLALQRMVYDVTNDVVELAGNYKRNWTLVEYTPDFSRIVRQWELKGCWIKTLSEGNFSHGSSDKRSIDLTIVYDRATPTVIREESAADE